MKIKLLQYLLEEKYNRKTIRNKVMNDLSTSVLDKQFEKACDLVKQYKSGSYYSSKNQRILELVDMTSTEIVLEVLIATAISDEPQPIQSVASRLANHLPYESTFDGVKTASELLAVICETNMFDIIAARNSYTGSLMVSSNLRLEEETLKMIESTKYLPPMVCKPNTLRKAKKDKPNMDTSHISFTDSLLLGKEHYHEHPLALDAINIANHVKLSLDEDILMFEETSNKELDTPEKVAQFTQLINTSNDVYNEVLAAGNEFYLTWKYDFRGRMYSQGYHVNMQSTGYKKALISLTKKEVITL